MGQHTLPAQRTPGGRGAPSAPPTLAHSPERGSGVLAPSQMTHKEAFAEMMDSIGVSGVLHVGQSLATKIGDSKPVGEMKRVAEVAKAATLEKLDPLKHAAQKLTDPLAKISQEELKRAEQKLRSRFGGYDDSLSAEKERERQLTKYMAVYNQLADRRLGGVPINDLEDVFAQAGLLVARTEVGTLSYEADTDGNGALDFGEFAVVLDRLSEYHSMKKGGMLLAQAKGSFVFGTEGASLTLKQVVWRTLDDPTFSRLSRVAGAAIFASIALAIIVYVLQSEPSIEAQTRSVFRALEGICLVIFSLEYVVKLATCPSLTGHVFSFSHAIDAGTLLPYFIDIVFASVVPGGVGNNAALRVLRVVRVFRIFKVAKYVPYVSLMSTSAASSAAPIMMAVFVMLIGMILLAFAAYFTERGTWDPSLQLYVQDDGSVSPFQSIGDASYWAVVTLTSVGYGDIVPASGLGKLVGAVTAMAGYIIVAFPVSIYTEEFSKEYTELVKVKALQAELGGDDLCTRLLGARKKALDGPMLKTFPAGSSLTDVLSPAVPRNIAMARRARRAKFDAMTDELLRGADLEDQLLAQDDIQPAKPVVAVARKGVTDASALHPASFAAVWRTGPEGRRNSLLMASKSGGPNLAAMFGSSEAVLRASSYAHLDLSLDAEVRGAILGLISDKRKQVWSSTRVLESRLRDDISAELARRWQYWMGMPRDYVGDLATPFVFRQKDLLRGIAFSRHDLGVGFVRRRRGGVGDAGGGTSRVRGTSSDRADGEHGLRHQAGVDGRRLEEAGRKIAGNFRSLVSAPSTDAAKAVLTATGQASIMAVGAGVALTRAAAEMGVHAAMAGVGSVKGRLDSVREQVAVEMSQALVPLEERERGREDPRNYHARLAAEYKDVLGSDGDGGGRRSGAHLRGTARGRAPPRGTHGEPAGVEQGGGGDGAALLQTAFGMSSVMPQMQVISSSVASGMASIAGGEVLTTSTMVEGYKNFWTKHFIAPLQGEDGEQVLFAAPEGQAQARDA